MIPEANNVDGHIVSPHGLECEQNSCKLCET
jgi:hypothetical protein